MRDQRETYEKGREVNNDQLPIFRSHGVFINTSHTRAACVCVCVFDTIGPVSPHPQQQKIKERLFTFFRKPAVSFHPLLLLSSLSLSHS